MTKIKHLTTNKEYWVLKTDKIDGYNIYICDGGLWFFHWNVKEL